MSSGGFGRRSHHEIGSYQSKSILSILESFADFGLPVFSFDQSKRQPLYDRLFVGGDFDIGTSTTELSHLWVTS